MTYGEYIISAAILAAVLFAVWRAGQLNPTGTGAPGKRMTKPEGELAETNRQIEVMRTEFAGDRSVNEKTWEAVDRLQRFFMYAGLNRIVDDQ